MPPAWCRLASRLGWAWFGSDDPGKLVTKNYYTECVGCHLPAKDDDWLYLQGYPVLKP